MLDRTPSRACARSAAFNGYSFAHDLRVDYPDSANMFADMAAEENEHRRQLIDVFAERFGPHIPLVQRRLPGEARASEDDNARRRFVPQIIQPGLVGLMDGSVSTLAPVFAAAFATHNSWNAFLVGMAASLGAGISMGFAEALADDGKLSGRGTPLLRGLVCGLMTIAGGIGHTLPYLIADFVTATVAAGGVVVVELLAIAWIQWRYMDTPPLSAVAKVMLGGALVFLRGNTRYSVLRLRGQGRRPLADAAAPAPATRAADTAPIRKSGRQTQPPSA